MNCLSRIIIFLMLVTLNAPFGIAALTDSSKKTDRMKAASFDVCRSKALGVEIGCYASWEFIEGDNAALLRIADYPEVTVVIAKTNSSIIFLEQLTREDLDKTARYAKGFCLERVFVGGKDALKIKAFSRGIMQSRLIDYYFIRDGSLWGLFFSVSPKEGWEDVKFLFADLVKSFHFIDSEVVANGNEK